MKLAGKGTVVIVTGGTRGIGRAVSLALADAGVETIAMNYLQDHVTAAEACHAVESRSARALPLQANLGSPDEVDALFARIRSDLGRVDFLVHCAALTAFKRLVDTRPNQWDLTLNINARGFLLIAQHAVSLMHDGGAMVALTSLGGTRVVPDYGAMGPAKAALESVVRYLAAELAPHGIRVNAVAAGLVETESIHHFPAAAERRAAAVARTPLARIGTPAEIADVVTFLLSPAARWICGQTLVADGGFSLL